jgi:glycosyltransferase involved in cell wall biosynthesis
LNSEKKKIIYVTVRADFGGGPYHIDLLIRNLMEKFDIYIASPLNKPFGNEWLEILGTNRFLEIPFRSFKIRSLLKLILFIKKNKIDILHAHGKGGSIYGRAAKIFLPKIKVLYTPNGFHILHYSKPMQKFYILTERLFRRYTDLFINVSKGERENFIKYKIIKESDSIIVYNAINHIQKVIKDKAGIRKSLNLPDDKFIVISVVRLNHQKNIKATIEIAEELIDYPDILFLIIGDGEEREEIENLIREKTLFNIELPGYKNNISEYLTASDIYLSTSLWEGLPYSLIEAAAYGLPIVASNVTGNNEVVQNGENGYLFELDNLDDAAKKILLIKNSESEQKLFGNNSEKIFSEKFQLDSMMNKMGKIYKSFLP